MQAQFIPKLKQGAFLLSLCNNIDTLLGGGFEAGTLTQLYGEPGSGKTNICLQAAILCAKSGKTVIYIDTDSLSPERFLQIANASGTEDVDSIAQRIIVYHPHNFEQQMSCTKKVEAIVKGKNKNKNKVALVILDSATLFYRLALDDKNIISLRTELANQVMLLLELARNYDLATIITNQIYVDLDSGKIRPAGGYALEHLSKIIVQLEKAAEGHGNRKATLRKHRSMPEDTSCTFALTGKGVEDM